jgi:hypothetical protein
MRFIFSEGVGSLRWIVSDDPLSDKLLQSDYFDHGSSRP